MYDVIVIGSGFAGATIACKMANKNKKVLVIEKRNHIGGNMYEEHLANNVRVHKYGPHIFHTNNKAVFDFLSNYTSWYFYEHRVVGKIDGQIVPIPFNFKSLELLFDSNMATLIKTKLIKKYPNEKKVSIFDLIASDDPVIKKFGNYVYEKVFVNYTAKQWNIPITEIDTSVINRVPVILGYDDRYFSDIYQYMPKDGYNKLFTNMLNHSNIDVLLNTDAKTLIKIDFANKKIMYKDKEFTGKVVFTGALDDFFDYKYGPLPYRSLNLVFENYNYNYYQSAAVVNYPNEEAYTRITEFKYLTNQLVNNNTTILKEYPLKYNYKDKQSDLYYAIISEENKQLYNKYLSDVKDIPNLYLCGRLAEYKYYNMDAVIADALKVYEEMENADE